MAGKYANQKLQLGHENGGAGTAVAATTIWRGHGMLEDAREQIVITDRVGIVVPSARIAVANLLGHLAMPATPATFEQLPYILEAGLKDVTPAQDGTGDGYIYAYDVGKTSVNTLKSYTIEGGDDQDVEEMEYSQVESFALSGKYGELLQMSAEWFGRQITSSSFTGALSVPTVEEIVGAKGTLYIDDVGTSPGTTQVSAGNLLEFSLDVTTGWLPRLVMDSGELYFYESIFDDETFEAKLTMKWRHTSDAVTEKGNWQSETPRVIRLEFKGSAFGTGGTVYDDKTLLIDMVGIWEKFNALENDSGDSVVSADFMVGYDETADITPLAITVVNELTTLP